MQSKKIKKSTAFIIAVLFLLLFGIFATVPTSAASEMPEFSNDVGESFVIYDKTHEKYITEEQGFAIVPTSTSAKITMGLVACEALENRLDEKVTVTEEMLRGASGYSMKLKAGERISIRDLLYGAICGSYNDAAYVLATVAGGSAQGFVELMNTKVLELGAKNTNYTNPLGYPDNSAMTTTAYDTLKIALAASENQLYMSICTSVKHTVKATNMSSERNFYNRNSLVSSTSGSNYYNSSCLGMNAGYSGEAGGWSIVTLIRDTDKDSSCVDYICVLLGGKENADGSHIYAYQYVDDTARWLCKSYNNHEIYPKGAQLGTMSIGLTMVSDAPYVAAESLTVYTTELNKEMKLASHAELFDDIKAPMKAGDVVGKMVVTADGEKIGECDLILTEDYEVNGVMKVIDLLGSYTKSRAFIATIICFVLILGGYFAYKYFTRYNSKGHYTRKR